MKDATGKYPRVDMSDHKLTPNEKKIADIREKIDLITNTRNIATAQGAREWLEDRLITNTRLLLSELDRQREEQGKLIEGLRWYADRDNYRGYYGSGGYWKAPANDEEGKRARDILKSIGIDV